MNYYMALLKNGETCHKGTSPSLFKFKEWLEISPEKELEFGEVGFHVADDPFMFFKNGCDWYKVEIDENSETIKKDRQDICCRRIRILSKLDSPEWYLKITELYQSIQNMKFLCPDGKPNSEWKLFSTRDECIEEVKKEITTKFGKPTYSLLVWKDTFFSYDMKNLFNNIEKIMNNHLEKYKIFWQQLQCYFMSKLFEKGNKFPRDFGCYAELMAGSTICENFDEEKLELNNSVYIKNCWDVWKKGYGLYGSIDGIFYVYEKINRE